MTDLGAPSIAPLPAARHDAMRRQLTMMVVTRRQSRRPLLIAGTAAAIVIGTSAGAYAYVQHSVPVTDKSQAYCYTVDTLAGGYFTTIAVGPPGSAKGTQIADALSVCADFWRQGILRAGDRDPVPPGQAGGVHPVPPLVACVLTDGMAAVFPGPASTCTTLGLPNAKLCLPAGPGRARRGPLPRLAASQGPRRPAGPGWTSRWPRLPGKVDRRSGPDQQHRQRDRLGVHVEAPAGRRAGADIGN